MITHNIPFENEMRHIYLNCPIAVIQSNRNGLIKNESLNYLV